MKRVSANVRDCLNIIFYIGLPVSFCIFLYSRELYHILFYTDDLATSSAVLSWIAIEGFLGTVGPVVTNIMMALGLKKNVLKRLLINFLIKGILMVPLDRSVVFLAKTTANFLFMLAVEVIAVPLFYFFFMSAEHVAPTFAWIVAPLLVGTLGMAGIGTMLSTITMNTRAKDVMLAVLFIPLIYPLLYACVTATTTAIMGSEFWVDFFVMPLVLACGYDVVMLLVCWVLYDFVVSA
jgi:O-antigen/teichoic acid export membrane protein